MKILLTNDDGIFAPGLQALYEAFSPEHEVTVVAPDRERSAVGHGITLHDPIRADKVNLNGGFWGYAVSGTPVDCIKLSLLELLPERPQLVISGINPGANVGVNVNYSGTVAAAKEAALYGIPAIAASVSAAQPAHYIEAAKYIKDLAIEVIGRGLPFATFLNVNLPDRPLSSICGIRTSRQGIRFSKESIQRKLDPRQRPYYWQGCEIPRRPDDPDIDSTAVYENHISITPIKCDMTDYATLETMRAWRLEKGSGDDKQC